MNDVLYARLAQRIVEVVNRDYLHVGDLALTRLDCGAAPIGLGTILYQLRVLVRGTLPRLCYVTDPRSIAWLGASMISLRVAGERDFPRVNASPYGEVDIRTFDDLEPEVGRHGADSMFAVFDLDNPSRVFVLTNYVCP